MESREDNGDVGPSRWDRIHKQHKNKIVKSHIGFVNDEDSESNIKDNIEYGEEGEDSKSEPEIKVKRKGASQPAKFGGQKPSQKFVKIAREDAFEAGSILVPLNSTNLLPNQSLNLLFEGEV